MSSHHFVKDQQEPAVFILDTVELGFDSVSPLLEWVPTVLVAQNCLDHVLSWGIKIDVILATETFQKENLHLLEEQYPVKFLTASPENTLDEGLQYLLATKHPAAHLVGVSHLRCMDLEGKLDLFDLTIMDASWKYYPVKSGKFKKWFVESTIRVLGTEGMPVEISNESGKLMLSLIYLTQLEVPEGITEIEGKGIFWVGEKLGELED
jgi:hypothetical protein